VGAGKNVGKNTLAKSLRKGREYSRRSTKKTEVSLHYDEDITRVAKRLISRTENGIYGEGRRGKNNAFLEKKLR